MYPSDIWYPFFSAMGVAAAIVFSVMGASYGTAKSGIGITAAGVLRPENVVRNSIPVVMAGILAVYGLVVSIMIANTLRPETHLFTAFVHLGAGIAVGLSGLGAGFAIGITGDAGVRGTSQQPRLFVGMMLIQIFSEVLGLYGMIVALIMLTSTTSVSC
ncbi:V-type ATPase [Glonium stellatum]|uniref:V-type proton ATPase proteolipid subunit n=1 Tax=Glonium stellatum TaxID=574774 RepID=A0A8E2EZ30_9PEZI|nr:V-type ATPase [Glonium stellatum]